MAQEYGASNSWTWETNGYAAGSYVVMVYVRSAGATAAYQASKNMSYTIKP